MLGLIARPYDMTYDAASSGSNATFPSANLANNDYGRVGRTSTAGPTVPWFIFDLGSAKSVDTLALLWSNLRSGTDLVRFRGAATAADVAAGTSLLYAGTNLDPKTGTSQRDVAAPNKCLLTLSTPVAARFWGVQYQINTTAHPDGYGQASRFFVGKSAIFQIGPQKAEIGAVDFNQKIQLETGEDRSSEDSLLIRPVVQLDLNYAKESEMRDVVGQYTLGMGMSKPLLIVPDITNNTGLQDQICFGRPENIISNQSDTYDMWKFQARVRSFGP